MKKKLIAILSLLLIATMVFSLVSCNTAEESSNDADSSEATESSQSEESQSSEWQNENGDYVTKLGVLDEYRDREFVILVVGESEGTYQSDDFTTEAGSGGIDYGDTYYEQVRARNEKVEENYGITLVVKKENNATGLAREDSLSGTQLYDAMILECSNMATLAQEGLLVDLNTLDNLDLDAPWWDASANEAYSIANKLFFSTGDITIMNKANTWSILFNKDMVTEYNLENPYDLVKNGTWTFDKMVEMAKSVSTASSSSDWQDSTINFGMVSAYADIVRFYGGFDHLICEKNTNDEPELVFGASEVTINDSQKILDTLKDASWNLYAEETTGGSNVWSDSFKVFYEGRALFRPSGFTATTKCRTLAEIEFGILPMPKANESQDEYVTVTDGTFAAGIPTNCKDVEFSAYMLDAFACEAKNFVTPAYIEVNLKWKSLRDDESQENLEYIFSHIKYDSALVYNFGSVTSLWKSLAQSHSSDVVSSFDSIQSSVVSAIEKVIADYKIN